MDDKILDWTALAEKFSADGDPLSMRTAAREIFELDESSAEGLSIMAEAEFYLGNVDEADNFARLALDAEPNNLRGRLVAGGVAVKRLELRNQLKIFSALIDDTHAELKSLQTQINDIKHKIKFNPRKKNSSDDESLRRLEKNFSVKQSILFKALCWSTNGLYLAGEPAKASANLSEASALTNRNDQAAELYSKHLFLRNYRDNSPAQTKELAQRYNGFFARVMPLYHGKKIFDADKKIHVGYISPDFREHALANFLAPLVRDFDAEKFSVTCYSTGKKDFVTEKFRGFNVTWRSLTGREPADIARIIFADGVDILVDLSGHSQDSCLPILAHKPAPIQICGLGYTATTGLNTVDYFLSDDVCLPKNFPTPFTEKILRLNPCSFCYAPDLIREMPAPELRAPVLKNNFVTFGSFNNFAKVSDDVLYIWRAILDGVPNSRLILKGKIFSLDDGKALVRERMRKISFPLDRVEFRAYSPDYLEQYRDVDIALDTFPYTGGTTTCEALYMGVPVITVRGKTHGARLSSSILAAADVKELIAHSPMDYIKLAIKLSRRRELIAAYHVGLREHVKASALMDSERYMRELENIYTTIHLKEQ